MNKFKELYEAKDMKKTAELFKKKYKGDDLKGDWEDHKQELFDSGIINKDELKKWGNPFNESKVTPSSVKSAIKKIDFGILRPEAFEVDLKKTDAGMGGEPVVRVIARDLRPKDQDDANLVYQTLKKQFKVEKDSDQEFMLFVR